jgi:predicted chitinase
MWWRGDRRPPPRPDRRRAGLQQGKQPCSGFAYEVRTEEESVVSTPFLRRGASGPAVRDLQRALKDAGFLPGPIDGKFGPGTEAAVVEFQHRHGLETDGEVGPATWGALDKAAAVAEIEASLPATPDATGAMTAQICCKMLPGAKPGNVDLHLPHILAALRDVGLSDRHMVLMAIATVAAETAGCLPIDEGVSRFNTSPGGHLFDKYDHREDLGNRGHGDGARYKGRGFVQLTGRANYRRIGAMIGVDLEAAPERANDPEVAARILAAFLKTRERAIKKALLAGDLRTARKLVNGGQHGFGRFEPAWHAGERLLSA